MTITKAARQALEALESLVHNTPYAGRYSDAILHLRAALQDKAGEVVCPVKLNVAEARKWRIVPLEPTTGMLIAGNHCQPGDYSAKLVWEEMLKAADRSGELGYTRPLLQQCTPASQEQAKQQPAPVVPDGWVSVDDAMPNQGALVLAYCKGDVYPDSAIWCQPKGWSFGDVTDQYWDEVQKPVTHWRPMPPIPATPKAVKRCDYPDCSKACGDAPGFCHKGAMITASQQKGGQ